MNEDFVFVRVKPGVGRVHIVNSDFTLALAEGDAARKVTKGEWNVYLAKTGLLEEVTSVQLSAGGKGRSKLKTEN